MKTLIWTLVIVLMITGGLYLGAFATLTDQQMHPGFASQEVIDP